MTSASMLRLTVRTSPRGRRKERLNRRLGRIQQWV